jgi:mannose/fructose/N-acetylgalactosamine-specific phosphotransferase system component IIC
MLPVLGFGILGSMLWTQHKHLIWVMFGFIAATYLRVPTLALAILATIVAIATLLRDVELHNLRTAVPTDGEEDFLDG